MNFPSNLSPRRFRQSPAGALLLLSLLLCACGGKKQPPPPQEAVPVTASFAQRKDVPVEITAIGGVEAYSTVQVRSMIAGEITRVGFQEGQDIKKGDLLFTIDRGPYDAALNQAQANLARDLAQAATAKSQAERYSALEKAGVISREQAELMRTAADAAQEVVRADQAAVQNAKVSLQYTEIYSPIDGRTGNLMVHLGNIVKANDVPLVTINQIKPIYVSFALPEQFLPEVKRFQAQRALTVTARVPNEPQAAEGVLSFIDNSVDSATGTIKLKGSFTNVDSSLWPGQFADVSPRLTTEPNVLVVPTQAVQTGQKGSYVFVVKSDHTAEARDVKVLRTYRTDSVLSGGLEAGEQVVTDGQLRLAPSGTKVELKPGNQNAGAPGSPGMRSDGS